MGRAHVLICASVTTVALAAAAPAAACRVDSTLDRPSYPPGETATLSGFASGPGAESAVVVRFTWGERGAALGEAPVTGADRAFSFSFTVPAEFASGSYAVYSEAFDAEGKSLSPLPGSVLLVVTGPPVARAFDDAVEPAVSRAGFAAASALEGETAGAAPSASTGRARAAGRMVVPAATRVASKASSSGLRTRAAASTPDVPAVATSAKPDVARPVGRPVVVATAPRARMAAPVPPAPLAAPVARPREGGGLSAGETPHSAPVRRGSGLPPLAIGLVLLALLGVAAAAWRVRAGARPTDLDLEHLAEIEAELQEIIAEERAQQLSRV